MDEKGYRAEPYRSGWQVVKAVAPGSGLGVDYIIATCSSESAARLVADALNAYDEAQQKVASETLIRDILARMDDGDVEDRYSEMVDAMGAMDALSPEPPLVTSYVNALVDEIKKRGLV